MCDHAQVISLIFLAVAAAHSRIRYRNNYLVNVLELPKMDPQPFRHPN